MKNMRRLIIFAFFTLIFTNHVDGSSLNPVLQDAFVTGVESWSDNGEVMIVLPLYQPAQLIVKKKTGWVANRLKEVGHFYILSHKGDRFAFLNSGNLYISTLQNKPVIISKASETTMSWSPDDKWLAYANGNDIWIVSSNLKEKKKVATAENASYPQWTGSGKDLIFFGIDKSIKGNTKRIIWIANIETGEIRKINDNLNFYYGGWTFWRDLIPIRDINSNDMMLLSIDGTVTRLTNNGVPRHFVRYDENGLYCKDGKRNLLLIKDDSQQVLMTGVDYVSISPNKKYIAYAVMDKFYIDDFNGLQKSANSKIEVNNN